MRATELKNMIIERIYDILTGTNMFRGKYVDNVTLDNDLFFVSLTNKSLLNIHIKANNNLNEMYAIIVKDGKKKKKLIFSLKEMGSIIDIEEIVHLVFVHVLNVIDKKSDNVDDMIYTPVENKLFLDIYKSIDEYLRNYGVNLMKKDIENTQTGLLIMNIFGEFPTLNKLLEIIHDYSSDNLENVVKEYYNYSELSPKEKSRVENIVRMYMSMLGYNELIESREMV